MRPQATMAASARRRGGAGDELQARRAEIARMEERALREAESLEVQRSRSRPPASGARGPRAQPRAAGRGAEAREARPAPRARADLGPERRAGQADPVADVEQEARHQAGAAAAGRSRTRRGARPSGARATSSRSRCSGSPPPHAERNDDPAGRAAQRRDEGPDHRPRRAQHPRAREAHGRRRDHRRDALRRGPLELRRRPARDRPDHARAPDRGRSHPSGADRGDLRAGGREVDARIVEEGERAALEARVHGLDPELVQLLGQLRFRTSYGQNVLDHLVECSKPRRR